MAKKRAGWERIIKYGTAGSAAGTQIEKAKDININSPKAFADTSDRGDGSTLPQMTEQVVQKQKEITFTKQYKDSDAVMTALLQASNAGTCIALLVLAYSGGHTEFDGDVYLEHDSPGGLTDGMDVSFTAHPTDDGGRDWSDYTS